MFGDPLKSANHKNCLPTISKRNVPVNKNSAIFSSSTNNTLLTSAKDRIKLSLRRAAYLPEARKAEST